MSSHLSVLQSDRPAVTLCSPGDVVISRAEWDDLQAELRTYRDRKALKTMNAQKVRHETRHIETIILIAAETESVPLQLLKSDLRTSPLPDIRRAVYVVARGHEIRRSVIARAFGRSLVTMPDWESVAEDHIQTDQYFKALVARLEAACS